MNNVECGDGVFVVGRVVVVFNLKPFFFWLDKLHLSCA